MPSFCAVLNCGYKYGHSDSNISFHKFPIKRKELLNKWIEFAQRETGWQPSKWMSICSQHFREEDFVCVHNERRTLRKNAVPSILPTKHQKPKQKTPKQKKSEKVRSDTDSATETDTGEDEKKPPSTYAPKTNCRLCGKMSTAVVTFSTNFEIYGMVQKCFPTLNIQQNDNLPKDMCVKCHKSLKNFSQFIDKVLETQSELQKKYRTEKSNKIVTERQLKIKQEPIVRVKQEVSDCIDRMFPEDCLDMGIDENCEQEQDADVVEQKLPFCDFPLLNAQDIINNCDIMEIINLDDPFINIPDDDGNTMLEAADEAHFRKEDLPSAHDLLQAHLTLEEHSYARPTVDFKDEYPLQGYKMEKMETQELQQRDYVHHQPNYAEDENERRSIKPIITSVSAIGGELPFSTVPTATKQQDPVQRKPNIVVLNESIVTSSSAFQLHACGICQLKFFSSETLSQHYSNVHGQAPPMVSVPSGNMSADSSLHFMEKGNAYGVCGGPYGQTNVMPGNWTAPKHSTGTAMDACLMENWTQRQTGRQNYEQVQILEMQQSFLGQQQPAGYSGISNNQPTNMIEANEQHSPTVARMNCVNGANSLEPNQLEQQAVVSFYDSNSPTKHTTTRRQHRKARIGLKSPKILKKQTLSLLSKNKSNISYEEFAIHYQELRTRYVNLRRKCRGLESLQRSVASNIRPPTEMIYKCQVCRRSFHKLSQLWRHKRLRSHLSLKPKRSFFAPCTGCGKLYYAKRALENHMRYICQSVTLRWFTAQLQKFKCRFCRNISFTHWRLFRKHEMRCKVKVLRRTRSFSKRKSPTKRAKQSAKLASHVCTVCQKSFSNANNLRQHSITHTEVRSHKCGLCFRHFKRRNGLLQHIKGFHLKVKPYKCPVCQHCYALKWDMLRCKHSGLQRNGRG